MDDLGNLFGTKFNYINNSGELGDMIKTEFDNYNREQRKKIIDPIVTTAKVGIVGAGLLGTQLFMQLVRQIPGIEDYLDKHSENPIVEILDRNTGLVNCKSRAPTVVEKTQVQFKGEGTYDFSGKNLSGTFEIQNHTNGITATGSIGDLINIGEVNKGANSNVTVIMRADGAHKKIYNNVNLKAGNNLITGLKALDTDGFNPSGFANYFLEQLNGKNATYVGNSIKCFIDPNLPKDYISETKDAFNEIAGYAGIPVEFVMEAKSNPGHAPADNEFWVNEEKKFSGVTNASYPDGGSVVKSGKVWYNLNSSVPNQIRAEVMDVFIQKNQNGFIDANVAKWFKFALTKRPQGDDKNYRFFSDHEEMDDFDSGVSSTVSMSRINIYEVDDDDVGMFPNPMGENGMRTKIGERQEFPHYDKATLPKNSIKNKRRR